MPVTVWKRVRRIGERIVGVRSGDLVFGITCLCTGAVIGAATLAALTDGTDWKLDWNAIAALATMLAVLAAVAIWKVDASNTQSKLDAEAKIHVLLLLPDLVTIRDRLDQLLPNRASEDNDNLMIDDVLSVRLLADREAIAREAELLVEAALRRIEGRLGLLPIAVSRALVALLVSLKALNGMVQPLKMSDEELDDEIFVVMPSVRLAASKAKIAVEQAARACNIFVQEELEDICI